MFVVMTQRLKGVNNMAANTVVLSLTGEQIDALLKALENLDNENTNLTVVDGVSAGKPTRTFKLEWIELTE